MNFVFLCISALGFINIPVLIQERKKNVIGQKLLGQKKGIPKEVLDRLF